MRAKQPSSGQATLPIAIPDTPKGGKDCGYEPLSSVWDGSDGELIEAMLEFYQTINPEPILDATYNAGRFWKESTRNVVSMDIDPQHKPMILCDNRLMTGVRSKRFGTVVYDPPHVGPQGRDKSIKRFDVDFGATVECGKQNGWSLTYLFTAGSSQRSASTPRSGALRTIRIPISGALLPKRFSAEPS